MENPLALIILIRSQLHCLKITAGIRLGQNHRPGQITICKTRQVLLLDLFTGERLDRLGNALQTVYVHQCRIGPRHNFIAHRVH